MSNQLPVLIVGAGPTGLMMACELARHGVHFRIIDKKPEPSPSSNATWIQTRTIELLDQIGIVRKFLEKGQKCDGINLYNEGQLLETLPLTVLDSIYQFVLMLPQNETEKILTDHLLLFNQHVDRSLECIDVSQKNNEIIATIRHPNGRTETLSSQWLIACDGANSTIRQKCNLFFPGEDLTEQFIVADAEIESFMAKNKIHVFFDQGTLFTAFPLGENAYRITANLHLEYQRKLYTEKEVIELAQERAHGAYYLKQASWISTFWIHSKVVKEMRHGSIFLAGDAAHVHSPAGGQGMNAGLQDAINLAWKIALVIKDQAHVSLLDSYQAERHPVAKNIVDQTEKFTKMILFDKTFLNMLKKFTKKISTSKPIFTKTIASQLTQLDICYDESPVIAYADNRKNSPRQGERAPDVKIDANKKLSDYLRNKMHNILIFTGPSISSNKLKKIRALQDWLKGLHAGLLQSYVISPEGLSDFTDLIHDVNAAIHQRYDVKAPTVFVVRPDNYIGYYSKDLDVDSLGDFFKKYLK